MGLEIGAAMYPIPRKQNRLGRRMKFLNAMEVVDEELLEIDDGASEVGAPHGIEMATIRWGASDSPYWP